MITKTFPTRRTTWPACSQLAELALVIDAIQLAVCDLTEGLAVSLAANAQGQRNG
jgi:hypothetical protein